MKASARYVKAVVWSDRDNCYIGSCPGLFTGGCHGPDEQEVFRQLCEIADDVVAGYERNGKPLPATTVGREIESWLRNVA